MRMLVKFSNNTKLGIDKIEQDLNLIQEEFGVLDDWSFQSGMKFNHAKAKGMHLKTIAKSRIMTRK